MTDEVRALLMSAEQTKTGLKLVQWDNVLFAGSPCCGYAIKLTEQGFGPYVEYYTCGKCRRHVFKTGVDMPPIRYQLSADSPVNLAELEKWVSAWSGLSIESFDLGVER